MLTGNRRPASAPKHQNHLQSENDGTIRLLFHQLRSYQSSTPPLPGLCRIESELQSYINKLKMDMENTRKDCQSQVRMLQKTIDDLESILLRVEDMSSGSDHCGSVSILGSMNCQQPGCFFRSDKPDELQRHTETGLHFRLQLQNFVEIHDIAMEAVSAPRTAISDTESGQMDIAEHVNTSMKSSAIPNDANPPGISSELHTTVESIKERETNPDQYQHPNQNKRNGPLHYQDMNLDEKPLGSKDVARFKCTHCSTRFTRSHTLIEHSRAHNGERPFGCSTCTKKSTRLKDRNRHQLLHSGEKRFICKGTSDTGEQLGCHRRFAREDGLLSHLRSQSAFQCLEPLLNIAAKHIFSLTNKVGGEPQYCPNPPNGCGLRFQHLKDFKDHYDSEAGKACVKSRLIAFALPYFDHKRVNDERMQTSTIETPHSNATEASKVPTLSSFTGGISPKSTGTHLEASGSKIPLIDEARTFDFARGSFALTPRKHLEDMYLETTISMCQRTTLDSEYDLSHGSFVPSGFVEATPDIGLQIESYTPTRGIAGNILQVKVVSFVPLLCAVFNIQIGFFVELKPRLQNMNAILASVEEERISPTSFYRYTVSARVPHPGNQPRMSPLPIILEINGLQRYGAKMLEFLEVGHFTYEEAHEAAEMIS